jgi:hypothetical protein
VLGMVVMVVVVMDMGCGGLLPGKLNSGCAVHDGGCALAGSALQAGQWYVCKSGYYLVRAGAESSRSAAEPNNRAGGKAGEDKGSGGYIWT